MGLLKEKLMSWFPTSSLKERPDQGQQAQGSTNHGILNYYHDKVENSFKRSKVYADMDELDDEVIAGALDMEADDATQMDLQRRKSVWVTAKDEKIKETIENLFNRIQLEQKIWLWTRETNKYGDFFVRHSINPDEGIVNVQDTYHPKKVVRLENNGKLAGFVLLDKKNRQFQPHNPYEWTHFRNLKHRIEDDLLPEDVYRKYQIDENARYGSPSFIKVRRVEKQLRLAEDSVILGRLSKSQYTQIHYVTVGDADPKEQKNIVNSYEKLFTKDKQANYKEGTFNSDRSNFSYADRVFVPVRSQDKGRSQVEEVGGDLDVTSLADIDMLTNKRFAALGIPKEYMSFESNLGFNTLMQLDPRYARKISNHQKNMIVGLTLMCQIELALKGLKTDTDLFQLHMTSVSTTNELERTDSLSALIDAGDRMVRFFQTVQDDVDMKYLYKYILQNFMNMGDINIDKLFQEEGIEVDGDGEPPADRQSFMSNVQRAVEEDPQILKNLNEFVNQMNKEKESVALKQRIQSESYDSSELDQIVGKGGNTIVVLKERNDSEEPKTDESSTEKDKEE